VSDDAWTILISCAPLFVVLLIIVLMYLND